MQLPKNVRGAISSQATKPELAESQSRSDPNAAVDARDGEPDCNRCGNKRFILDEHDDLLPCPDCNVAQKWKVQAVAAFSSRSKLTVEQTFLNFITKINGKDSAILQKCLSQAEKFADKLEGRWLVFWGERGSGKSHLCAAIDNHLHAIGVPSLFITMPDLLTSLRQAMDLEKNTETESYSGRLNLFKKASVLILDDLGAETGSSWSVGVLFEILDYRYRNRLPTVIATNLDLENELTKREEDDEPKLDKRVLSRLMDKSFSTVIENAAPDYRQRSKVSTDSESVNGHTTK